MLIHCHGAQKDFSNVQMLKAVICVLIAQPLIRVASNTFSLSILGVPEDELLDELKKRKDVQVDPHTGKIFAYVYTTEDERFHTIQKAFDMFEFDGNETNTAQAEGSGEETISTMAQKTGTAEELRKKDAVVQMFFHAFMHDNALNPMVFPSLRQFEVETVAMVANMLNGDGGVVGSVTSGGTESILMAVKTYRDRARSLFPSIKRPEIVRI